MRVGLDRPAVPPGARGPLLTVASCAALVVVALGIVVARTSSPFAVDDALLDAAGGWTPRMWTVALPIDFFGEPLGVVLVATALVAVCLVLGRPRLALLAVVAQGAVWVSAELVKRVVDRTIHGDNLAFPSGHTAGATAFALVAGLLLVGLLRLGRVAALLAVLGTALLGGVVAAWAQIVLGAHYATDTFGGLCLALAVVPALALVVDLGADRLPGRAGLARAREVTASSGPVRGSSAPSTQRDEHQVTPRASAATYRACEQGAEVDRR